MGSRLVFSRSVDACWGRPEYVSSLEHVQARLSLSYTHRGSLAIHLSSPLGTRSTLLADRYHTHAHTLLAARYWRHTGTAEPHVLETHTLLGTRYWKHTHTHTLLGTRSAEHTSEIQSR